MSNGEISNEDQAGADQRRKYEENLRAAEDMLIRYIQQRKKPLARLALQTFAELTPEHPRLGDYTTWVEELDKEVVLKGRISEQRIEGRQALQAGDLSGARRALGALRRLDPMATETEEFAVEVARALRGEARSADIGRLKASIQEHLDAGRLQEAENEIGRLSKLGVPKVTVDFLHQRLRNLVSRRHEQAEIDAQKDRFEARIAAENWQGARDLAHEFARRYPNSPRPGEMFDRVNRLEAASRRRQSIHQGVEACERFLGAGQAQEARLALQVLRGLHLDDERLAELERRLREL